MKLVEGCTCGQGPLSFRHALWCGGTGVPACLPALPADRTRMHVALWKIAKACGHDLALDAHQPDHVLVELVAQLVTPALAKAFRDGFTHTRRDDGPNNPYDGSPL